MSCLRSTYVRPPGGDGETAADKRDDSQGMSPLVCARALRGKPDALLVALARSGNDAALAEIVARYRPTLPLIG